MSISRNYLIRGIKPLRYYTHCAKNKTMMKLRTMMTILNPLSALMLQINVYFPSGPTRLNP